MAINKYILIKFGLLLFCASCTKQEVISPPDRLVFVEGKELTAGRFGDLVMMGPDIEGKKILTNDSYYDAWPMFKDTSQIIFLSKRREGDKRLGLNKHDDLFLYNQDLVKPLLDWTINNMMDFYHFDNLTQVVLFKRHVFRSEGPEHEIVKQNIADSSDQKIIYDRAWDVKRVFLSPNNEYLLLEKWALNRMPYKGKLYLYSINENYEREILNNHVNPVLGLLNENYCWGGSFISGSEFLFSCSNYNNFSVLYLYDISANSMRELFRTNQLVINNPISNTRSSKVYFLARPFNADDIYENIWVIDKYGAPGDSAVQLTNTRLNKDWLQIEL